jgi:hypothetical protein
MKKALVVFLILAVAGGVFADPIGLTVGIDGFNFGDVINENFEFASDATPAVFTPFVQYDRKFGPIAFRTHLQDEINLDDKTDQTIRWTVRGFYGLQIADASTLTFKLYNKLYLEKLNDNDFADSDADGIRDLIQAGVQFDQKLSFGTIYAAAEVGLWIHTQDSVYKDTIAIDTGDDERFKVGVTTNFGLYGYVQPYVTFTDGKGGDVNDPLTKIDIRIGYKYGPIDGRVTVSISTIEKGMDKNGLRIRPRVTYTTPLTGLVAYLDLDFANIGSDDTLGKDVSFKPAIGVTYAF